MPKEKFEFDVDLTMDSMAYASTVDMMAGQVTMYAVVCIGSGQAPHYSHGGQLCLEATTALNLAKSENDELAGNEEANCRYLPLAVGVDPNQLASLLHVVGHPFEEPEL